MTDEEHHERQMIMNAHFAWALVMWASADCARERSNFILSCYGYYYAAFHATFSMLATDHTFHLADTERITHSKLERYIEVNLPNTQLSDFEMLQAFRETTSYLGMGSGAGKLRVVRGHPFGFDFGEHSYSFSDAVEEARKRSRTFVQVVLAELEGICLCGKWRGPKSDDDIWVEEYLQEDVFQSVIPCTSEGVEISRRAFSLLNTKTGG